MEKYNDKYDNHSVVSEVTNLVEDINNVVYLEEE